MGEIKKTWKTVEEAKKELGDVKLLQILAHGYNDIEYRTNRRKREQALLKRLRTDPKYMSALSNKA